jgi:hypothetical protein
MSIVVRQDFINFCNTRKHVLLHRYPNATAQEIVALMLHEFNELTPLPPPYINSATNEIEQKFESLTISGMLFNEKNK